MKKKIFYFAVFSAILWSFMPRAAFSQEPADRPLVDGTYRVTNEKIEVAVTVVNGRLIDIEILRHNAPQKYKDLINPLAEEMIMEQSSEVDGITGATSSSDALKAAVREALEKAKGAVLKEINSPQENL